MPGHITVNNIPIHIPPLTTRTPNSSVPPTKPKPKVASNYTLGTRFFLPFPCISCYYPLTLFRHLFKSIVKILVGSRAIFVHKELLCSISPVFNASLTPTNPHHHIPNTNALVLSLGEECRLEDFEYLVQWMYTRTLDHECLLGPHPAYFRLIRLYILAHQFRISRLKNAVVDMIARVSDATNSCLMPQDTKLLYEQTGEMDKLRVLVLDLFEWKVVDGLIRTHNGW